MIKNKSIPSIDLIQLEDLRKLLKASVGVWYIFEEDTIIVYGMNDVMFTLITRIIVPNTTSIKNGTLCFYTGDVTTRSGIVTNNGYSTFCKGLVPLTDISFNGTTLVNSLTHEECSVDIALENEFIQKRNKLNSTIDGYKDKFSVSKDIIDTMKLELLSMRATMSQKFFSIADRFLVTLYAGMLPVNKPDSISIDVAYDNSTFLCKYEILKKKAPAPIHVFIKYCRL